MIGSGLQVDYQTVGIFKAYATRVGNGPFPSELFDEIGDYIAETGVEFGTVTKRKRRCGWLDLVSLKYSCQVNRVNELCITKIDVLKQLKKKSKFAKVIKVILLKKSILMTATL